MRHALIWKSSKRRCERQEQLQAQLSEMRQVIGQLEAFAEQVRGKLDTADWTLQRQLISTLVKRVEIGAEEVRIVYRVDCGPFELAPSGGLWQDCWRRRERDPSARWSASRQGTGIRSTPRPFLLLASGVAAAWLRGPGMSRAARNLVVLQVVVAEADRHRPIQTQFDDHLAAALSGIDRLVQLVEPILEADRVVVGHHPLLLDAQDRRQVDAPLPSGAMRVAGLRGRHAEAPVVLGQQPLQHRVGLRRWSSPWPDAAP